MARTNRKDATTGPASVDALDDLNLDDMFEDGDDNFFDGLDIDLDGMGEIPGPESTKRVNEKISNELDAIARNLPGDGRDSAVAPSTDATDDAAKSSRRKTKRKIKSPLPSLDDEDEDYEVPAKKKRRPGKASSKKTKGTIKTSKPKPPDQPPEFPTELSPRIKKPKILTGTSISFGHGIVAAAGQFGGRNQKKGGYTLPLGRDRQKSKNKASTRHLPPIEADSTILSKTKNRGSSLPSIASPSTAPPIESPKSTTSRPTSSGGQPSQSHQVFPAESTFCGLLPSRTIFYPFMPSLPSEPSMKKCHRHFAVLDKINSANTTPQPLPDMPNPAPLPSPVPETEPIFRLMLADLDQQHPPQPGNNSIHLQRRATLGESIVKARQVVAESEKDKLVADFHSVCALVKRQYDFLSQSLNNMERWCRDHFSEADHASVYGTLSHSPNRNKRKSEVTQPPTVTVQSTLASLRTSVVKVKIKCHGFKEPKLAIPLIAHLVPLPAILPIAVIPPPSAVVANSSKSEVVAKSPTTKKRKLPPIGTEKPSVPGTVTPDAGEVIPYAALKPSQRRQRVTEVVTREAQRLDEQYKQTLEKRMKALDKQYSDLQKVVDDDDLVLINTTALWKWMEKSPYFADIVESDIRELLQDIWEPEIDERDLASNDLSLPIIASATCDVTPTSGSDCDTSQLPSAGSVLSRLQSLLVVEDSDDDDDDDPLLDLWDRDAFKSKNGIIETGLMPEPVMDLTDFTIDERAYFHLRAAGLVSGNFVLPALLNHDKSSTKTNDGEHDFKRGRVRSISHDGAVVEVRQAECDQENDIDAVIQAMQVGLSALNRRNNARAAFLESAATAHIEAMEQGKRADEENILLLSKYNQFLKKQKETKRSVRQKIFKKDEDWVPW